MEEPLEQTIHFTRDLELWEATYQKVERRGKLWGWQKIHLSERKCQCPDREKDRQVLLGIRGATISAQSVPKSSEL